MKTLYSTIFQEIWQLKVQIMLLGASATGCNVVLCQIYFLCVMVEDSVREFDESGLLNGARCSNVGDLTSHSQCRPPQNNASLCSLGSGIWGVAYECGAFFRMAGLAKVTGIKGCSSRRRISRRWNKTSLLLQQNMKDMKSFISAYLSFRSFRKGTLTYCPNSRI